MVRQEVGYSNHVQQRQEWSQQLEVFTREMASFLDDRYIGGKRRYRDGLQAEHERRACVAALNAAHGVLPKAEAWIEQHKLRLRRALVREHACLQIQALFRANAVKRAALKQLAWHRARQAGALAIQTWCRAQQARRAVLVRRGR